MYGNLTTVILKVREPGFRQGIRSADPKGGEANYFRRESPHSRRTVIVDGTFGKGLLWAHLGSKERNEGALGGGPVLAQPQRLR
jgi:hypothetical protein